MKLLNAFLKFSNPWNPAQPSAGAGRYAPHQSSRERQRRIRQLLKGQLQLAGVAEARALLLSTFEEAA